MRHAVHHIIQSHPKSHRRKLFRILRVIRPLPRIPQVHVVADRYHQPPMLVPNPAPLRHVPILLVRPARQDVLRPRHLEPVVHVVQHVEDLVLVVQVLHRILVRVREDLPHPAHEVLPVLSPVEVVHHQESALQQILPHPLRLVIGKSPRMHHHRIHKRIVVDVIVIQAHHLLSRSPLDPRQPIQRDQKLPVRLRIVPRPCRPPPPPPPTPPPPPPPPLPPPPPPNPPYPPPPIAVV